MSLTSRLDNLNDPARHWIDARFPNISALVTGARREIKVAPTVLLVEGRPPTAIGMAIDYRLRYAFGVSPVEELVAFAGAPDVIWNVLAELDENLPALWTVVEKSGLGIQRTVDPFEEGLPDNAVTAFFAAVRDRIPVLSPVGRRLDDAAEDELARYCLVLALFEEVYRTGALAESSLLYRIGGETPLAALLAALPEDWVADLVALASLALTAFAERLDRPAVLNPVFAASEVIGGADADLIADGALVEVKATVNPRIDGAWIRQLVGYTLLDTGDEFGISAIALYLARQGRLFEWPINEALQTLAGGPVNLAAERTEFAGFLASPRGQPTPRGRP